MSKVRTKDINGYIALYLPDHPSAKENPKMFGWVYEHRLVAESFLNRRLYDGEEVHHLDENKKNNHPENLLVLTQSQHAKLHAWMRRMGIDPKTYPTRICKACKNVLWVSQEWFCCDACAKVGARKVERPSKEQLTMDITVLSLVKVGQKYGVSDNSIRKWCKFYEINIQPKFARYRAGGGGEVAIQLQ
jgi:hypothetical protein